jgi:hypothetical protein
MEQYKPYNPGLTQPPVQNPHSPATSGYRQQPVEIPGVLHQSRELFKPYTAPEQKDSK